MRKGLLLLAGICGLVVALLAGPADAAIYLGFENITNNGNPDLGGQLLVEVLDQGSQVAFTFTNAVGITSSICDIYFADGTLLELPQISQSAGVVFSEGASPPELPGADADFKAAQFFSADSKPPHTMADGVNSATEWLTITFDLKAGKSWAEILSALATGELRMGLHVQGIGAASGSDSYMSTSNVIPEPTSLVLWGGLIAGACAFGVSRRRTLRCH